MPTTDTTVLVVGAGPVGLLVAFALGKAHIPTIVLEKHIDSLPNTTRAVAYQPVVLSCLQELGLLEKIKNLAYLNKHGMVWRDEVGNQLAHMPVEDSESVLLLGQARMANFLLDELKAFSCVEIRFGQALVGIEQDSTSLREELGALAGSMTVTSLVHGMGSPQHEETLITAQYVLGTDGANSSVRHALCIPFAGFDWTDFQMLGCDVLYDFAHNNNWGTPMQFIVHPTEWAVIVYTGQDKSGEPYGRDTPLFRVAFAEATNLDTSDPTKVFERAKKRIKRYARGSADFEITRAEPYHVQQRCATLSHKGNVFLAGDALHSNNPIGGLGLTAGILDAFCYGNALVRVIKDGESPDLLGQCANSRREAFLNNTNPASIQNLKNLMSLEAKDVEIRESFFRRLRTDQSFPPQARAKMQEMLPETFSKEA